MSFKKGFRESLFNIFIKTTKKLGRAVSLSFEVLSAMQHYSNFLRSLLEKFSESVLQKCQSTWGQIQPQLLGGVPLFLYCSSRFLNCISLIFSESYSALLFESLGIFRVLRPWNVFRKDFGKTLQNYLCKRFLKLFQKSLESNFPERLLKNLHTGPHSICSVFCQGL